MATHQGLRAWMAPLMRTGSLTVFGWATASDRLPSRCPDARDSRVGAG